VNDTIEYILMRLEEVKSKVDVLMAELEDRLRKERGELTREEAWLKRKAGGE
tara:strand:+ start:385 stop:540 length:156 start_codon:yes stop_codon:yes gene_type:complete